ncbi:hypothetical protein [Dactylosporangium cerinum]
MSGLAVTSDDPRVTAELDTDHVSIPPGTAATVNMTIHWDAGARSTWPVDTRSTRTTLRAAGKVDSPGQP